MKSPEKLTPLLKQYYAIKKQHPGRILFFRMGDFYELFGDDAVTASSILGIALTSRDHGSSGNKMPLAGVPHHTLNRYLVKMLKAGFKVAVCDQVEDPREAKGIVKREVVEVLTPGSITLDGVLDTDKPNYLAGVNCQNGVVGLALLDISTGRFLVDEFDEKALGDIISFYNPSEIILAESQQSTLAAIFAQAAPGATMTPIDDYRFDNSLAFNDLIGHFKINSLDGFGLGRINQAIGAAGAAFAYVRDLKLGKVGQITRLERIRRDQSMELDSATIRNLELVEAPFEGRKNSLLSIVDKTVTAGGGRLVRSWILSPLIILEMIQARQRAVVALKSSASLLTRLSESLKGIPDLERLASKVAMRKAGPRDLIHLKTGLENVARAKSIVSEIDTALIREACDKISDFGSLCELVGKAIVEDPPGNLSDGGLFRKGFSLELDQIIESIDDARRYIHDLQRIERENTGISSLKVGFNKIFGYYIEITKPHLSKVPSRFIRKQTLVSAERFITEELKTKEELILTAEEKIKSIEYELYDKLLQSVAEYVAPIQTAAQANSTIDVLAGFALLSCEPGYIMPELNQSLQIEMKNSRHPVLERILPPGKLIPNDISMDGTKKRISIITGPNMAGKSTYLRQSGLLVLMAQIGAPIPASEAQIGVCDRIFTRVGASDDIMRGRSTFLVEMTEAAAILNGATDKSLILLDELGRGTSTYDGLAIAWSLVEYLNAVSGKKARTLFATHYHELIGLAEGNNGIINLQVAVKQWQDSVVFLYKIIPGGCDDSYGIQVAKLAGLPQRLLDRAREILSHLETGQVIESGGEGGKRARSATAYQISLFSPEEAKLQNFLEKIDPENLTPLEALSIISELKKLTGGDERKS